MRRRHCTQAYRGGAGFCVFVALILFIVELHEFFHSTGCWWYKSARSAAHIWCGATAAPWNLQRNVCTHHSVLSTAARSPAKRGRAIRTRGAGAVGTSSRSRSYSLARHAASKHPPKKIETEEGVCMEREKETSDNFSRKGVRRKRIKELHAKSLPTPRSGASAHPSKKAYAERFRSLGGHGTIG